MNLACCDACPLSELVATWDIGVGVPAAGSLAARVMFVGQNPGLVESRPYNQITGKPIPFIGPAGQLLHSLVVEAGYPEGSLYVTNAVKHRSPGDRAPTSEEYLACSERWLKQEIATVKPEVILCLGKVATFAVSHLAKYKLPRLTHLRGLQYIWSNSKVISTWHPSAILRADMSKSVVLERELLEDLIRIKNAIWP